MNFVEYFPKLSKFKISNVEISYNKNSNQTSIDLTFIRPRGYSCVVMTEVFSNYHNYSFTAAGVKYIFYCYGWGDSDCKSVLARIVMIPLGKGERDD